MSGQTKLNRYKYFQSFEFKNHKDLALFVRSVNTFVHIEYIIPNGKGGVLLFVTSDRVININASN